MVLFENRVKVLAMQSPADAMEKVKTMIQELITKLKEDAAAEATQKAWCDAELAKNDEEQTTATTNIETHTASIEKLNSDVAMLEQEITVLDATVDTSKKERTKLATERAEEKEANEKVIAEAEESIEAVDAAITVLEEYYANK